MSQIEILLGAGMLLGAILYARLLARRGADETLKENPPRAPRATEPTARLASRPPAAREAPAGGAENLALLLERFDKTARMRLDEFEAARRELLGILERAEAILERAQAPTPRGEEFVRRARSAPARPRGDTARIESPRTAREAASAPARPADRSPELRVGFQDLE